MSKNKTYRLTYNQNDDKDKFLSLNIQQDFDFLEILSLKISQTDAYKLYTSDYGVLVGRVLANDGFGIPNAKISIFTPKKTNTDNSVLDILYPYKTTNSKNANGVRYNLLPSKKINKCHQNVGTFPSKRGVLDNKSTIEVFDDYYKYTTTTNESGDYMIFGVPTGNQEVHVDLDLSDIGVLSQTPRDMSYKGYDIKQFESPNKFKKSTNLDSLPQIISQSTNVFVYPFWGDETQNKIAVTKKTINIQYKFEPTCVFIGSIFTDSIKNYVGKTCNSTEFLGKMSELSTSRGSIEMIRKTLEGNIERFDIDGTRLIDGDGVWCYQIPMNLDYVITDEYGNLVPTDDPTKGIPTRTKVRFRVSTDNTSDDFNQVKTGVYLIPNKPTTTNEQDYNFDGNCKDSSFVDFMWNKVYSIKNYIPRVQKNDNPESRKSTGLKQINYHETNNPTPYNNIFIDINLRFSIMCLLSKFIITIITLINKYIINFLDDSGIAKTAYIVLDTDYFGDNCNTFSGYKYVSPTDKYGKIRFVVTNLTILSALNEYRKKDGLPEYVYIGLAGTTPNDTDDTDFNYAAYYCDTCSGSYDNETMYLTNNKGVTWTKLYTLYPEMVDAVLIDKTVQQDAIDCIATQLALENQVVNFEFNNDWLNGSLYAPKFQTKIKLDKKTGNKTSTHCGSWLINKYTTRLLKTCTPLIDVSSGYYTNGNENDTCKSENAPSFGKCSIKKSTRTLGSGIITSSSENYYYKSTSFLNNDGMYEYLFATDVILLGSLNDCDVDGIPKLHQLLPPTTFTLPPITHETDNRTEEFGEAWVQDYTSISGIDWGLDGSGTNKKYGLFANIDCMDSDTIIKTCVNAERICELGVELDETVSGTSTRPPLISDGYISTPDEIGDGDARAMFASLNYNNLQTYTDSNGMVKYNLTYLFPDGFDGSMNTIISNVVSGGKDTKNIDYIKFRSGDGTRRFYYVDGNKASFQRYENSFYFYFGLKPGSTAIDKFNSQYYVPCN